MYLSIAIDPTISDGSLCRSGIGRELVLKILARGDKAIATARARSFSKLADLKAKGAYTYELDVTAPDEDLQDFARRVIEEHGHVDVIVNNAGKLCHCLLSCARTLT